ncbi:unnamed protein product [Angiostrongylus costaricensis]|uniref:Ras-associating domain-containing protein n=1 Tax=Angiostrongylus costaricensis TaxID=334426 RepID=A0A158PJV2_ANGCS|nr:unnamed protein product [Angiostrongylus costaricensis]
MLKDGGERVLTKCVRVSSTATTRAVVDALTEKFLPDLKMLSDDTYTLWELHESGGERKLDDEEKPLLVQLTWHRDDREGRFLLRKSRQTSIPLAVRLLNTIQLPHEENLKRATKRFSKREKKELKKKHQKDISTRHFDFLLNKVPPNSFTRTISNPEVVMKKRREKKLETRLKEMGHGGSLKIYGGELVPSRPYVTILVSMQDRTEKILLEALEKYGFDSSSASDYVLVEVGLDDPEIRGRHCVITYMDGIVTITPSASDAVIEINNRRIGQTEILRDGDFLRMGRINLFQFVSQQKVSKLTQNDDGPRECLSNLFCAFVLRCLFNTESRHIMSILLPFGEGA